MSSWDQAPELEILEAVSAINLSPHESRCLFRRLAECDELLQVALLGADQACQKTHNAGELVAICSSLEAAEAHIERARGIAERVSGAPPAPKDMTK